MLSLGLAAVLAVGAAVSFKNGLGPQGIGMATMLEGDWVSDFGDYHAVFQTHDGTYQILAVYGQPAQKFYYSRGMAVLKGNLLTLTPSPSMGAPESQDAGIVYRNLTSGAYNVVLKRQGDHLVWLSGPRDPERSNLNPAHPLIQYSGKDSIRWGPKI